MLSGGMEAPVGVRQAEENGMGNWHPARRPDSKLLLSHYDKHITDVLAEAAPEEQSQTNVSTQGAVPSLGATALYEGPTQSGSEENVTESTPFDRPRREPFASDPSHSAAKEKKVISNAEGSHKAGRRSGSSTPPVNDENNFVTGQEPAVPTMPGQGSQGTSILHQAIADASPPGLPWNPESAAERVSDPKKPTEEHLGLSRFDRTNSFPDVQPLPQSSFPPHLLPHSQAEDIMEEDEQEKRESTDELGFDAVATTEDEMDGSMQDLFSNHIDGPQHEFFSHAAIAQGSHVLSPPDDEARFEEGLPLMPSSLNEEDVTQDKYSRLRRQEKLRNPAQDAGKEFFSKPLESASEEEDLFRPLALDRKTTSQVLDSMQYPPHSEIYDEQQPSIQSSSLADLTGGGIAVSSSTVISQVLSEQPSKNVESGKGDDDLAAMWQAALDDDELLDEDDAADPSSLFEDDGPGFLDDSFDDKGAQPDISPQLQPVYSPGGSMQGFSNNSTSINPNGPSTSQKYTPGISPQTQNQLGGGPSYGRVYNAQAVNDLSHSVSAPTDFQNTTTQQPFYGDASAQRPQMPSSAQSFADKSKGGYTSPYDLPMDVTRPKKRNVTQQLRPGSSTSSVGDRPSAPPRSSSMFTSGYPGSQSQAPLPPLPKQTSATRSLPMSNTAASTLKTKTSGGSFFEELPSVKPRPQVSTTRSHAPFLSNSNPPQPPHLSPQAQQSSVNQIPASSSSSSATSYGLVPPGRIGPYSNEPHQAPNTPGVQSTNSKYSPAPVQNSSPLPSRTRYAASPAGSVRAPPPASLAFQPRTSSPLAQNNVRPVGLQAAASFDETPGPADLSRQQESMRQQPVATGASQSVGQGTKSLGQSSGHHTGQRASSGLPALYDRSRSSHFFPPPPTNRNGPTSSSSTRSYLEPDHLSPTGFPSGFEGQHMDSTPAEFAPPRRSQTQSPGALVSRPSLPSGIRDIYQRPASVNDRALPPQAVGSKTTSPFVTRPSRSLSKNVGYLRPTDGRENDPLERWKGCPLFAFGFGGSVVTSFPKLVQRYAAGHSTPLMKCSPGEVKIQSRETRLDDIKWTSFPGPLKSKSKKKEILEWLQQRILQYEQAHTDVISGVTLPDPRKRNEEKILLWRTMKVLVEFDGVIGGKPAAEQAVRLILSPELAEDPTHDIPQTLNSQLLGISRASGSSHISDPTQPGDVETLRRILLQGEREKAVWHALDRRLWAHAMLISSTLDKQVWKQVLQEFIRQEVKSFGDNTESLAALYQIFAGNGEESVDELVPPSARAGLQFVSKAAGSGPTKNALDGLDRWRETLSLALSNRTHGDGKALVALGRLLSGYGRVEAAHICFIFAKIPGIFAGADDPQASFTLLGTDQNQQSADLGRDIDSILLTEVYEYASVVLAPSSTTTISPHLQAYKLYHAMLLAEHGSRNDAQEYCNAVTSAMKSTTKPSPYYHSLLFAVLDDLVNRLRQAPNTASASWMSKPSLDKVSGSFFSRVNQFIAGDESDADSAASGKATDPAAGPFAGVIGDTPNISRSPSSNDLYSAHPPSMPLTNPMASTSRYAPGGQYAVQGQYSPRSSSEQSNGHTQDSRGPQHNDMLMPSSSGNLYQRPLQQSAKSSYEPAPQQAPLPRQHESYPTPSSTAEYMLAAPPEDLSHSLYNLEPYRPTLPSEHRPSQNPYGAPYEQQLDQMQETYTSSDQPSASIEPTQSSYPPPSSSYESPSMQEPLPAYEAPSYNPYTPETPGDNISSVEVKVKKSILNDDEDDFEARAAAILKEEKARKDREADEAFRKVAEADGMHLAPPLSPIDFHRNLHFI